MVSEFHYSSGLFQTFTEFLLRAYLRHKDERRHPRQLLLEWKGWRMSLVEAEQPTFVLSYPALLPLGGHEMEVYDRTKWPEMPQSIESIVTFFDMGDIERVREFPSVTQEQRSNPDLWSAFQDQCWATADAWGREFADAHIADVNPTFQEAQARMERAYAKLFEVEHALRDYIEKTLQSQYKKDWWNQALAAIETKGQDEIKHRQQADRYSWLDTISNSRTRFLDFDHHRQIVIHHKTLFAKTLPSLKELTDLLRDLNPNRNRVGHMNALSGDNYTDFMRMCNRVIALVRPRPA